jgi:PAS domain-containing protein
LNLEDCPERIRLTERYSRAVTVITARMSPDPRVAERARAESEEAWRVLEAHIAEHKCLASALSYSGHILEQAAIAAIDVILVSNDDRCFVEANQAAADAFGIPREEIIGRRIEEFFAEIQGQTPPEAFDQFIAAGVHCGVCTLTIPGRERKFEYQARANFAPGLHLGILREVKDRE